MTGGGARLIITGDFWDQNLSRFTAIVGVKIISNAKLKLLSALLL